MFHFDEETHHDHWLEIPEPLLYNMVLFGSVQSVEISLSPEQ